MEAPFRFDYYQNDASVIVSIYVKNVVEGGFQAETKEDSLHIRFKDDKGQEYERRFALFSRVSASSAEVLRSKVELTLVKAEAGTWLGLEKTGEAASTAASTNKYPSSARKPVDVGALEAELANEPPPPNGEVDDFFKALYKDADEDTRRAMVKSFTESSGTVLSTNWDEVKVKKVQPAPPSS